MSGDRLGLVEMMRVGEGRAPLKPRIPNRPPQSGAYPELVHRVQESAAYKNEGIWLYGVDTLDATHPTAKDKVFLTLERLTKTKDIPMEQVSKTFDDLIRSKDGEQVRQGDLVATYDALTLRCNNLKDKVSKYNDWKAFEEKRDMVRQYLQEKNVDISDTAVQQRLQSFRDNSVKYHRGMFPEHASHRFNQLTRRAAALETYCPEEGKRALQEVQQTLREYPSDQRVFQRVMTRERLYAIPPTAPVSRRELLREKKHRADDVQEGYGYAAFNPHDVLHAKDTEQDH